MTQAELDHIHERLRDDNADRAVLLVKVDRLTAEIDAWRAQLKASQAEIKRLEGLLSGVTQGGGE